MSIRTSIFSLALILIANSSLGSRAVKAADSIKLYTPYTSISVAPGKAIDYSIEVINDSREIQDVSLRLSGLPGSWITSLKSGSYDIRQIAVLPDEKRSVTLRVEVPLRVNKGTYRFKLLAGSEVELPLSVRVTEQGTYSTEFTCDQANMQGDAKSTFTFNTDLHNRTAEKQLYSLRADLPPGWVIVFKPNFKQATSVEVEANTTEDFNIDINPPDMVKAGTYKIPVYAVTGSTSAELELEVVITGTYDIEVTTPRGLLSTRVTAGDERTIELVVRNTGSVPLTDISLDESSPINWEVNFDPEEIDRLATGSHTSVMATIKADKNAIAGDYVTKITAKTLNATDTASFRVSVRTPMIWGWIGIFIVLIAIGSVWYLFRKYGRR